VFIEGHLGSNVELFISLALAATLIFAPLTIASIGRRLWLNYKFTNKRVVITNTSPLFKREVRRCKAAGEYGNQLLEGVLGAYTEHAQV
jgi:hypothetical protein